MSQNQSKTETIKFTVSSENKDQIQARAKQLGLSVASYCRMHVLPKSDNKNQEIEVEA